MPDSEQSSLEAKDSEYLQEVYADSTDTTHTFLDQRYYWTDEWQDGEAQASIEIKAGKVQWLAGEEVADHFHSLANLKTQEESMD